MTGDVNKAPVLPVEAQSISPWSESFSPVRILIIRMHALGDVAVTFPASLGLRNLHPDACIEYLTSDSAAALVGSLRSFNRVYHIPVQVHPLERLRQAVQWGLLARRRRYDVILDLQRNWVTRTIRRIAAPRSWGEFDRYAPKAAADRVIETFRRTGFPIITQSFTVDIHERLQAEAVTLLRERGYDSGKKLIVLNPAGLWETRNWPLDNYVALARAWLGREQVQFLLMGTERIRAKAMYLLQQVGRSVIDLVGQTTLDIAFAVLQHASAVVTEDSGLMHMAWCSGIPTVALFGSSRHVWSAPTGPHARCLHSGDLPCGQCMESACRFGDVHCLTRYTPERVLELTSQLLSTTRRECRID